MPCRPGVATVGAPGGPQEEGRTLKVEGRGGGEKGVATMEDMVSQTRDPTRGLQPTKPLCTPKSY